VTRRWRARSLLVDVTPLRLDRDFRWLWAGQALSGIGTQVTRIALPYQVYVLTGSTLAVAVLTAVQLVPILAFVLGAGSVADAVDRRRLLLVTQAGQMLTSAALVVLALGGADASIDAIYLVAFLAASLSSIGQPARSSAIPRLVPGERLQAAIALNQLNFQVASVVGPAVGGILIASVGLAGAYAVDTASFVASLVALLAISPLPPLSTVSRPGLAAIREGLRFARERRVIMSTFVVDLNAMIFGMPTSLFPVLGLDVFKAGPTGVGLLAAAPAAGALLGSVLSGWVSSVRRVGRAIVIAVVIWGLAIAAFGLACFVPDLAAAGATAAITAAFGVALLCLAVAGAADVLSAVFRSAVVQRQTPDHLRGRVTAIHILAVTSGPRFGDIEAATVASVVGAAWSVLSGGLLCVIGVAGVVRWFPELWRHTEGDADAPLVPEAIANGAADG
jgi:MFS family permease